MRPAAESLHDQGRERLARGVLDCGNDAGAGLHAMDAIKDLERGHALQARLLVGLVIAQTRPGLEQALAGQRQPQRAGRLVGSARSR